MRPDELLAEVHQHHPRLNRHILDFVSRRGKDLPAWPSWCLLPMAGWSAITSGYLPSADAYTVAATMPLLAAVGTWQYSKGVYRLQDDIARALAESEISGIIPP